MARIRSVKPTFWTDEKIGTLPRDVRLTFLGLISAMADDHGRLSGVPRIVRGAVYPYDEDITTADIDRHLAAMADAKLIVRYQVNGGAYIHIRNWKKHQRVDKPSPSLLPPPPPDEEDEPSLRIFDDDSANDRRTFPTERSGAEGNGREMERSGADGADECPSALAEDPDPFDLEQPAAPPAPRVALPPEAGRFLDEFYGLATPKRRADVKRQLYDAVDPEGRGARIQKGLYVKARSMEHLAETLRAVLSDPPRHPDAAVVLLLKKLSDPPPGPTATEIEAKRTADATALEEAYQAEAREAGLAWSRSQPEAYRALVKPIDREFGQAGESAFARAARDAQIAQATAREAGFPSFGEWVAARNGERGAPQRKPERTRLRAGVVA